MAIQPPRVQARDLNRIFIASPSALLRQGVRHLARLDPSLAVIGECGRSEELVASVAQSRPDILLLDQDLTEGNDLTLLGDIASHHPKLRTVLLLAGEPPDDYLGRAAAAGAAGFVLRQADPSLLVKAVRAVASGRTWIQRELTSRLVQDYVRATTPVPSSMHALLSSRQKQLLVLLAQGLRNRDIARQLGLSEKTVKAHLTVLFRKLGVSSRVGAACYAVSQGLCPSGDKRNS